MFIFLFQYVQAFQDWYCGFLVYTNCCLLVKISAFYFSTGFMKVMYTCALSLFQLQLNSNCRMCLPFCFVSGIGIRWTFYVIGLLMTTFLFSSYCSGRLAVGRPPHQLPIAHPLLLLVPPLLVQQDMMGRLLVHL